MDIIIILILLYLLYLSQFYLPAYFKKKGENYAQLQDMEELTTKIDSIKQEFIERTEYLKAKLDLSTQLQIGHSNEERNAIMSFLRAFSNYQSMCFDTTFGGLNDYENIELYKYRIEINSAFNQVRIANTILKVFIDDAELFHLTSTLLQFLIEIEHSIKISLIEIERNNFEIENCKNKSEYNVQEYENLLSERVKITDSHHKKIIEIRDSFFNELNNLQKSIRKHLTKTR